MSQIEVPFVGQAYQARVPQLASSECDNLMLELGGPEGRTQLSLVPVPQQTPLVVDGIETVGDGPIYGVHSTTISGNQYPSMFVVSGDRLFEVAWDGTQEFKIERAVLGRTWSSPVQMADNGLQLIILETRYPGSSREEAPKCWLYDMVGHLLCDMSSVRELSFTNGLVEIVAGSLVIGGTSAAVGSVAAVKLESGSWGSAAAGKIYLATQTGSFQSETLESAISAFSTASSSQNSTYYSATLRATYSNTYYVYPDGTTVSAYTWPTYGTILEGQSSGATARVVWSGKVQAPSPTNRGSHEQQLVLFEYVSGAFYYNEEIRANPYAGTKFKIISVPKKKTSWEMNFTHTASTAPVFGDTITGLSSGATGLVLSSFTDQSGALPDFGMIAIVSRTGTFQNGETLQVGGVTFGTCGTALTGGSTKERAYLTIPFTAGNKTIDPKTNSSYPTEGVAIVGDDSSATAIVEIVSTESGDWGLGTAAGKLFIREESVTGTFQASETITASGVNAATIAADSAEASLIPFSPSSVDCLDQRFLMSEEFSGKFWYSGLLNGADFNALNFYTAESMTDNLRLLAVHAGAAFLLGEKSCEVWVGSGNSEDPFRVVAGAISEYGVAGRFCVAKTSKALYWISGDVPGAQVVRSQGYQVVPMSTPTVEYELNQYSPVPGDWSAPCFAWSFRLEGHEHVVFNFLDPNVILIPTFATYDNVTAALLGTLNERTWVYDLTTDSWRTESQGPENTASTRSFPVFCTQYRGRYIAAGCFDLAEQTTYLGSPSIKRLDCAYRNQLFVTNNDYANTTPGGTAAVRTRVARHMLAQGKEITMNTLVLDVTAGFGANKPSLTLSWSDDSGDTWSTGRVVDLGELTDKRQRVAFNRLGKARNPIFRVQTNAAYKFAIFQAWLDYEVEP